MAPAKRISEVKQVLSRDQFIPKMACFDTVRATPLMFQDMSGQYVLSTDRKGIMNERTGQIVGVASNDWTPVQHKECMSFAVKTLEDLYPDRPMYGRMVNNGNNATIEVMFDTTDISDKLAVGVRLFNRYKVGSTFAIQSFFVRSACQNGMIWSDVSANMTLSHLNRSWEKDIVSGVGYVADRLALATDDITDQIDRAKSDVVAYSDFENLIYQIMVGTISEKGYAKFKKSLYYGHGDQLTRYELYNWMTAYATHMQPSELRVMEIQKSAQHILKTPFETLFQEVRDAATVA